MSDKVKILAFAGSLRKDSFNKVLAKTAANAAEQAGADVTYLDLADYPLPVFDQDLEAAEGMPQNAKAIKTMMMESDGFIISSPEYNGSITAALKNAIDWASRKEDGEAPLAAFKGKTALTIAASPGPMGGIRALPHLRTVLSGLGVHILPDMRAVGKAHELISNGEVSDPSTKEAIEGLGSKLAAITANLKS